eukprot:NODE_1670_length_694_cov_0.023529.p1 type:complete len:106 gc:universal NODE_1670_length_694_cov_0.023529:341-24(-)
MKLRLIGARSAFTQQQMTTQHTTFVVLTTKSHDALCIHGMLGNWPSAPEGFNRRDLTVNSPFNGARHACSPTSTLICRSLPRPFLAHVLHNTAGLVPAALHIILL